MKKGHPQEAAFGMEFYSTNSLGVGGRLKHRFEDFIVEEISVDGNLLSIDDWQSESSSIEIEGIKSKFLWFIVQKMGMTTIDTANILAAKLKIPRHLVSYAGLKDKRAVTTQAMSCPASVSHQFRDLHLTRIDVRNLRYTKRPIQIGDLWGNRFTILLRDIEVDCPNVCEIARDLLEKPLLNYFGVQRFGVLRPSTHLIGKALVKGKYEEAVRYMLTIGSEYESEDLRAARAELSEELTLNESILAAFPQDLKYERNVIHYLIKHPGEYSQALSKLPGRLNTIFIHSYQSYLFNCLLSLRVKEGFSIHLPEPGDFTIRLDEPHSGRDDWHFVTGHTFEHELELEKNREYGLAIPIPGYSTKTPPTKQTILLQRVLKSESVELCNFRNRYQKALDSPGGLHQASIKLDDLAVDCQEQNLKLGFNLRKGQYATVVMREVMKNHPINRV